MTERLAPVSDPAKPTIMDDADPAPVHDLALLVPERLLLAIGRRRQAWSTVDSVAAWLTVIHLVVLLVIVGRGSFYIDDLRAQGYAVQQPFWHFILGSNGTHFAPLPRLLDWLQSRLFPLEHTPATVVTLAVRTLLAAGFWRVLRRLFGARPATLVPLAVLLFTPALVPSTTWYRQSITVLACTVAIVWAIDAQLRWVLYRQRGDLLAVALITATGLACYEKAAAIPVVLLGLTLAVFAGRSGTEDGAEPGRATSARPVRAGLSGVVASAAVVVVFLVIYRAGPYQQGDSGSVSALDVLRLSWQTSIRLIPLLFGGPYHWIFPVTYAGTARFSQTVIAFCLVLVLLGLAVAVRRGPARTGRALIVLLAWLLPSVAIVAAGRFAMYGITLADATRLWADLVPAFLLVGGLAVLPWQIGVTHSTPDVPAAERPSRPVGAAREITVPAIAGALVLVVVFGGSLVSSFGYATRWWRNPTGQWIANARISLVDAEPDPRMLATPLPEAVMPSWVAPTFPTDAPLLLLLRPDVRLYDGDGTPKVMNAAGVRSAYLPIPLGEAKKAPLCVAAFRPGTAPVQVPLLKPAVYRLGAQIEVGLLLNEPTTVRVDVVTPDGTVLAPQRFGATDELPQGPHDLHFPIPYGTTISAVQVQIKATKISCVAYARVWAPAT